MKEFWNNRYRDEQYAYGESPNEFFKEFIDNSEIGKILLPAEGEGRNSVYAAEKGWICDAFDFSEQARSKALKLAFLKKVTINYFVTDYENFQSLNHYYDVIALIFTHLHINIRKEFFRKVIESIKVNGYFVMQVFSKKQLNKQLTEKSGGPNDINLLYSKDELIELFKDFEIIKLEEKEVFLSEGSYHNGKAAVIEAILRKIKKC